MDLLKGGRDADPRQQTLRATIEWSHDLLTPEEQALFARLAVFRGGCTLEAAEEVANADLDTLQSLVDKSLLRHREDRFWMLETIRDFAAERLAGSGETEDLRRRHAEHFVARAEEAEPHLHRDSAEWAGRLESEHDNLRAVLDRLEASGDTQGALALAGSVMRFWYLKSHLTEGHRRLESALLADARPTAARAKALNGAAVMALNLGDILKAKARAEEAVALHHTLDDPWGSAYSGFMVANALAEGGELAAAQPRYEESIRAFRELGEERYALIATANLAWVTGDLGDPGRERALLEETLRGARKLGDQRIEAQALASLAFFARDDGNLEDGEAMLKEAIRIDHEFGDVLSMATNLGRLASVLARGAKARRATQLLASSEALTEGLGASVPWAGRRNDETRAITRADLDEAVFDEAWEQGRNLTVDDAVTLALES